MSQTKFYLLPQTTKTNCFFFVTKMNYVNLDNICRSCTRNDDLQPIQDHFVIDLFQKLIDVNYSKTDGLPQKICESCIQTIYSIQTFVLQCKTNGITLKKYLSMSEKKSLSTSANTRTVEDNKPLLSNVVSTVENNLDQIQPEELINDAINCSNETIDLEMNDHVLENTEFNVEHGIEELSQCESSRDSTISYVINVEGEKVPGLNMETEKTTNVNTEATTSGETQILTENNDEINNETNENRKETEIITENNAEIHNETNEISKETEILTENNAEIHNETNEINNETNTTIRDSVTIETDTISEKSSDGGNENRINDKDIERRVNLGNLLSELQKQYPFDASDDLLKRELDFVSLQGGEFDDKNDENVQNIIIPVSHLLTFDDNIIIVDSVSSNCKRIKVK